jgi:CspA family cold shock protein
VRQDGVQLEGDVQWFHVQKGFGFLNNISDGGDTVYVHFKDIVGFPCLIQGQRVQFVFQNSPEGKKGKATDVRAVGGGEIKNHGSLRNEKFRKRLAANPDIKLGYCKWFDPAKGYGFITPDGGGDDIFAHYKAFSCLQLPGTDKINIPQGMDVEYQVAKEEGKDKLRCISVTGPGGQPLNPLGPLTAPMPYMEKAPLVQGGITLIIPPSNGRGNKRQAPVIINRPAPLLQQTSPGVFELYPQGVISTPLYVPPISKKGRFRR